MQKGGRRELGKKGRKRELLLASVGMGETNLGK